MSDAADYLSNHFTGTFVSLSTSCCPKCLKGEKSVNIPLEFRTVNSKRAWEKCFERTVYPPQALNAFLPKDSRTPIAGFHKPLIDMDNLGPQCEQDCPQICLLCHRMIADDEDSVILNQNPKLPRVHAACMTTCGHEEVVRGKKTICKTIVPSLPEYILNLIPPVKCSLHQRVIGKPPLHPMPTKQAPAPSKPTRPMPSPQSPPRLAQPPPAIKTQSFKKAPVQKRPTRLEKDSERGLSHNLARMFSRQDPKRRLEDGGIGGEVRVPKGAVQISAPSSGAPKKIPPSWLEEASMEVEMPSAAPP